MNEHLEQLIENESLVTEIKIVTSTLQYHKEQGIETYEYDRIANYFKFDICNRYNIHNVIYETLKTYVLESQQDKK